MNWSTSFESQMPDGVTVALLSGLSTDGYGTETFASGTTFKARIVRKQHPVYTAPGVEEIANTLVYIASTTTFAPSAQFTLSDGTTPRLMQLNAYPDSDGVHHVRASFG